MTLFVSLIVPQAIRSVEPIYQVRAAELGQSLISEIASKSFDENASRSGGNLRCNDTGAPTCSQSQILGVDANESTNNQGDRSLFDDVDDYHNLSEAGVTIRDSLNMSLGNLYQGFSVAVEVVYDDDIDGIDDSTTDPLAGLYVGNTKLITVTVTTPNNEQIVFSTYRTNY
jgi:MSHA pilin protein MshD